MKNRINFIWNKLKLFSLLMVMISITNPAESAYFMGLGDLDGGIYHSNARGISADGLTVVGNSNSSSGYEAFRWTEDTGMVGIGDLSGGNFFSVAEAMSADGSVIVGRGTSSLSTPNEEAFRWTQATGMVGLGDLPGDPFISYATSISADGSKIAGYGFITGVDRRAFIWTEIDDMVTLEPLPIGSRSEAFGISGDGSVVVGWRHNSVGQPEAFRWTQTTGMVGLGFLPEGGLSIANGVSADGSVVVGSAGQGEAFRWTEETDMVSLGYWNAYATSGKGHVVVGEGLRSGTPDKEAIIWDVVNGTRYLEDVLTDEYGLDLMGWELKGANDISDDGTVIVGWGKNPDGFDEAWIAEIDPIPIPDISVLPLSHDFGDVELGSTSTVLVNILNDGDADLSVTNIGFQSSSDGFSITSSPLFPATLTPSQQIEVEISFNPLIEGYTSGILDIESSDPDEPIVQVDLTGTGVNVEIPPSEQIAAILDFIDTSILEGTLEGVGPGNSAEKRLNALSNMIDAAGDLIEGGYYEEACNQLNAIYKKMDGSPKPPDFCTGTAASELRNMILELMAELGCE